MDKHYRDWLTYQPCCVCGGGEWHNGTLRSQAAHVRRVSKGAGTGIKPAYQCVPLCHKCHHMQHQHGESAVAEKEWFDAMAEHYLALYNKGVL